jgi:hypothetical protein
MLYSRKDEFYVYVTLNVEQDAYFQDYTDNNLQYS